MVIIPMVPSRVPLFNGLACELPFTSNRVESGIVFLIELVGIMQMHSRVRLVLPIRGTMLDTSVKHLDRNNDIVLEDEFLLTALKNRRSVSRVAEEEPPEALIRTMLEAATWAPNHHLTEPWRFFVFRGAARAKLGAVMGEAAARREDDPGKAEAARGRMLQKPLRAPYIIAVATEPDPAERIFEVEEIAAAAAATQNMLLAAEALGLGAIWRSGWVTYCDEVREYLGLSERATVLGFVYVGYTSFPAAARVRQPVEAVTTWME